MGGPALSDDPDWTSDMLFLEAWEGGRIPYFGALLRVRQIVRASKSSSTSPPSASATRATLEKRVLDH